MHGVSEKSADLTPHSNVYVVAKIGGNQRKQTEYCTIQK